jgi:hypothetical protein
MGNKGQKRCQGNKGQGGRDAEWARGNRGPKDDTKRVEDLRMFSLESQMSREAHNL